MNGSIMRRVFATLAVAGTIYGGPAHLAMASALAEEIRGKAKTMGEVRLDDGNYGQMAVRTQRYRKIRSSDGGGKNSVLSMMVWRINSHKLGGRLGNIGGNGLRRNQLRGAANV